MRLLVVLDESELGLRAAMLAATLAARLGAEITLHVAIPVEHVIARSAPSAMDAILQHKETCRQRAAEWFARANTLIQPHGVATRTVMTIDEDPCAAVIRMATEQNCCLIVVGSQGRGMVSQVLGGSLVADLVRLSPIPVLVCREDMALDWPGAADTAPGSAG